MLHPFQVIAPVSAFNDRLCIASNGTFKDIISPETPLACCKTCGWGCSKGYPKEVNNYLVKHGAVTGAEYYSDKVIRTFIRLNTTSTVYLIVHGSVITGLPAILH